MSPLDEETAAEMAREVWPEAEGFERVPLGWTFRIGAGYSAVTDSGHVVPDPQGLRSHAQRLMPAADRPHPAVVGPAIHVNRCTHERACD